MPPQDVAVFPTRPHPRAARAAGAARPGTVRRPSVIGVGLVLALAAVVSAAEPTLAPPGLAAESTLRQAEKDLVDLVARLHPTVVAIAALRKTEIQTTTKDDKAGVRELETPVRGSGLILSADGQILTNEHVIRQCSRIVVTLWDGREIPARVLASDERSDLAVLKIEGEDLQPARLGDLARTRPGQFVIAMGNPYGLAADGRAAVSIGIVSAVGRHVPALSASADRYYGDLIQTTAQIAIGNSGGPIFNLEGEVIGLNTIIPAQENVPAQFGFAVPISKWTRKIIEQLRTGQPFEWGYLGVLLRNVPGQMGALVDSVAPETPAYASGVAVGDLIVECDGEKIIDVNHLIMRIGTTPIGQPVVLKVLRKGKPLVVKTTVIRRKDIILHRRPATTPVPALPGHGRPD